MQRFFSEVEIEAPRPFAFRWHEAENAFERLNPPWDPTRLVSREGNIESGIVKLKTKAGPFWIGIQARHSKFIRNEQFFDEMIGGPFSRWEHLHKFETSGTDGCKVLDQIEYKIKGGFLGQLVAGKMVQSRLQQLFKYRRVVTQHEIEDHFKFSKEQPKKIAVTGASGLIGKAICEFLIGGGHQVIRLNRSSSMDDKGTPAWNPSTGEVCFGEDVDSVDCFLHLAGYPIADKRWNERIKNLIKDSRVDLTEKLASYLSANKLVKESFVCASATGYYGDRSDEDLTESSSPGQGFLAEICEAWESASSPLREAGVRVVNMRFGLILSAAGGALNALLLPFKLGLGGKVGSGKQYWSWISFFDTLRAIHFSIMNQAISGPINFTSENPVTQKQFAKCLGKVLFRPTLIPLPAFAARLVLGEMANHLILAGAKVLPGKLAESGFQFVHNNLEDALRFELGRVKVT